jgi:hypothetical protein
MKNLLLVPSPAIWPVIEFEIDILQTAIDEGYNVTYVYCKGKYKSCIANKENSKDIFNPFICIRCKNKSLNALKMLSNPNKVSIIENNINDNDEINKKIIDLKEVFTSNVILEEKIKKIVDIDNCDIFDSALSTLMTTLKDSKPVLENNKKLFFDYLIEGLITYYFYDDLFKKNYYNKIIIYNGRVSRYRPILRLCKKYNLYFEVLEYPEYSFDRYILTPNQYPHDFSYRSKILRNFADEYPISKEEKIKSGKNLIEDSLNHIQNHGIGIGNFVFDQKQKELPINWDEKLFNITIYTSSDFENAGINEYYNQLYNGSQRSTIKALRSLLPNEFHITIRIHPNQKDKDLKSAQELESLQSNNITIVKAKDKVDSYYLAIRSDLIITFGSQLSVESAYLGKPVIVFGNSNFDSFNFTINVGKDIILASEHIKNIYHKKSPFLKNDELVKEEVCLHMFARKNQGTIPKYLKKNTYYGGVFLINGKEMSIKIDKHIYFFTKYLGAPIVLYNLYKSGGVVKIINLLTELLTKKTITNVKN